VFDSPPAGGGTAIDYGGDTSGGAVFSSYDVSGVGYGDVSNGFGAFGGDYGGDYGGFDGGGFDGGGFSGGGFDD
jgi:hypothetical protein